MTATAHVDMFIRDRLPPKEDWPILDLDGPPPLHYPARLNAAVELLDRMVASGHAERPCMRYEGTVLTYAAILDWADRIARALVDECGLVPGGRVLLRGPNEPAMAVAWLAVLKAGGVVVTTMPLLRARELAYIIDKARVSLALCDAALAAELDSAVERALERPRIVHFNASEPGSLESMVARTSAGFPNVETAADDPAFIAFTSGTTGAAKGTVHFHRDILAACDCWPTHVLRASPDDVFFGSPPLAFTYGLGGQLIFPLRIGASTLLVPKPTPDALLAAIAAGASVLFTSPTMYRALLDHVGKADLRNLRTCVSAGEPLPLVTYEAWLEATGLRIIDGIGATEMLHIFISSAVDEIKPGATGKVVPGYRARVVDDSGKDAPPGEIGRLAVIGPTGCRYLDDPERQRAYVKGGWNYTGDAYVMDADGYFHFHARADDMIISAGYNISPLEVESVLLEHPSVKECGVVAAPDPARGHIVKAYIVLRDASAASPELVTELQDHVKREIAPYKYPRAIEFVETLPRTETGKLQRFKLRQPVA